MQGRFMSSCRTGFSSPANCKPTRRGNSSRRLTARRRRGRRKRPRQGKPSIMTIKAAGSMFKRNNATSEQSAKAPINAYEDVAQRATQWWGDEGLYMGFKIAPPNDET